MRIGLGIGICDQAALGGGDVQALINGLKAFSPELLLVADAGAQDNSGNGRNPFASVNGNSDPSIEVGAFSGRAAFRFQGTHGYQIPPFAARHFFIVFENDVRLWTQFTCLYMAGGNSAANYTFVAENGGGFTNWLTNPGGSWFFNKVFQQGVSQALSWDSTANLDCLNLHEVQLTNPTQAVANHHLGEFIGDASRNLFGRVYAVVAYSGILSTNDRNTVTALLQDYFRHPLIIGHGDSLTKGQINIQNSSYLRQLRASLGRNVQNIWPSGIDGAQIPQLTANLANAVTVFTPNTIVLMAGSNDFGLGSQPAATVFNNLVAYCTACRAANPNSKLIVGTLKPATNFTGYNNTLYNSDAPVFNAAVVADARFTNGVLAHGVVRLDQIAELTNPNDTTYTSDGLHLTAVGYALVAAAVQPFI